MPVTKFWGRQILEHLAYFQHVGAPWQSQGGWGRSRHSSNTNASTDVGTKNRPRLLVFRGREGGPVTRHEALWCDGLLSVVQKPLVWDGACVWPQHWDAKDVGLVWQRVHEYSAGRVILRCCDWFVQVLVAHHLHAWPVSIHNKETWSMLVVCHNLFNVASIVQSHIEATFWLLQIKMNEVREEL